MDKETERMPVAEATLTISRRSCSEIFISNRRTWLPTSRFKMMAKMACSSRRAFKYLECFPISRVHFCTIRS